MVLFIPTRLFRDNKKLWSHTKTSLYAKYQKFFSKIKKKHPKVHANEQFVNKANFLLIDNSVRKEFLQ